MRVHVVTFSNGLYREDDCIIGVFSDETLAETAIEKDMAQQPLEVNRRRYFYYVEEHEMDLPST
jgi:hypothetical protein